MLASDQVLNKGRYRIINSIGQNPAGGTYTAYDTVSNANVVLHESVGKFGKIATPSQVIAKNEAFAGGAKMLTNIKHESLVSVQDFFSEIDRQYLVLETAASEDLSTFLDSETQRPSLKRVLAWTEQLLNGLNYLHRLAPAVYHCDIRPENMKLTVDDRVKLLMTEVDGVRSAGDLASNRTIANTAFHYRPLEQLWNGLDDTSQRVILNDYDERSESILLQPIDARSDLYSLAASLYHVISGTLPFDSLDRSIAIHEGKPDPLLRLSDLDHTIPAEISDVFTAAMSIRRESRFDSAIIMLQVLRTASVRVTERIADSNKAVNVVTTAQEPVQPVGSSAYEQADTKLELDRQRSQDRQREIEAEQARLDADRERIEQRRIELEKEKQRQQAEREKIEFEAQQEQLRRQQAIDLEAEKSWEVSEKERADREAEVTRRRADQIRIEAEAAAKLEEVEVSLSVKPRDPAYKDTPEGSAAPDDEELLELEPAVFTAQPDQKTSEPRDVTPAVASFEPDEWKVPANNDLLFQNEAEPVRTGSKLPFAAAAMVGILVVAAGVWKFMPGADAQPHEPQQTVQNERVTSAPMSVAVTEATPSPENALTQPTDQANFQTQTAEPAKRPQIAQQDKTKKPVTAPAKPTAAKKAVTVDDLIKDN